MSNLIYIRWMDSYSPDVNTWMPIDEISFDHEDIESIGWIINEDEQQIQLAASKTMVNDPNDTVYYHGIMAIPKCSILFSEDIMTGNIENG